MKIDLDPEDAAHILAALDNSIAQAVMARSNPNAFRAVRAKISEQFRVESAKNAMPRRCNRCGAPLILGPNGWECSNKIACKELRPGTPFHG